MCGTRIVGEAVCGEIGAGVGVDDGGSKGAMSNGACACAVLAAVGSAVGVDVGTELLVGFKCSGSRTGIA